MNIVYSNGMLLINGKEVAEVIFLDGTKEKFPKLPNKNANETVVSGRGNFVVQGVSNSKITISK